MRKLKFTIFILFISIDLLAQGPGLTFTQTSGTYNPINGGTVLVSGIFDDDNFAVTLPTAFTFKGVNYTQVTANTNGWISMGSTAPSNTTYSPVSSTTNVPGFIAAFAMDLENADAGAPELRWEQSGNEIIFQWKDVKRYTAVINTEVFSFQLRLNTASGVIQFVYGLAENITTSTISPQVGIRAGSNAFPANIYNRLVNTTAPSNSWATSIEGTAASSTCRFTSASPAASPASGQTFTWTPDDCNSYTCTSNISPVNGSTINTGSVNLSWNPVAGVSYYRLYIGNTSPLTLAGTFTGTTATINNLVAGTTYTWYAAPAGFNCTVSGCESSATTFNTVCAVNNCTSNISPANGITINSATANLSWNAAAGATSYNLYFGTSLPLPLQGNYTGTSATINNLITNATYYWYVSPAVSNCSVSGCESTITSFNSGCVATSCVSNIAPVNAATVTTAAVPLSWNSAAGATSYDLYLDTSNPPTTLYGSFTGTSATVVLPNNTYYWYIHPRPSCLAPTTCSFNTTQFTVNNSTGVVNDICAGAIDLANEIGLGSTPFNGNFEYSNPSFCLSPSGRDIWFKFKATATTASVSVTGAGACAVDPGISLFSGTCGNLTCLGGNDSGGCTTINTVSATGLTIGNIYYARVSTFQAASTGIITLTGTNIGTTVLPLNLLSFSGTQMDNSAKLQWKTANEINLRHFELQRSEEGLNFATIGTLQPGASDYAYTDLNIFITKKLVFYRLKSVDLDGRFNLSNIIRLQNFRAAKEGITVFPNPVKDVLSVVGLKQNGFISLFGTDGKLLQQQKVITNATTINMNLLHKGVYWLQYNSNGEVFTEKIIKQ